MTDLEMLIATHLLTQAKACYCWTIDMKDWESLGNLMIDNVHFDVSDSTGIPPIIGRGGAVDFVRQAVGTAQTAHQVHNPQFDINEDSANVVWPMQDRLIFDDGLTMTGYGHYRETWIRADKSWKLTKLKLTRLIVEYGSPSL